VNKVTGIEDTIKALRAVGASIEGKELQNVMRNEGRKVIATAKAMAPVDSGDLRDSIGFITSKDDKYKSTVLIGTRRNYYNHYLGVMYEFGTAPRIQKNGRYTGTIEPRPFMRPALDKNKQSIVNGIFNGVSKIVTKLAKKYKLQ
jgi:HK97 gp10 family phage protein